MSIESICKLYIGQSVLQQDYQYLKHFDPIGLTVQCIKPFIDRYTHITLEKPFLTFLTQ